MRTLSLCRHIHAEHYAGEAASDTLRRLRVLKFDMRRGNDNEKRREWLSLADFLHTERGKGNLAALEKLRLRVMTKRMTTVALAGNWCFALFDSGDGLCILDWHVWLHQALGKTCKLEVVLIIDFPRNGERAHDLLLAVHNCLRFLPPSRFSVIVESDSTH